MIWPLSHLLEAIRFIRLDHRFEDSDGFKLTQPDVLAGRALAIAISQLGQGEEGGDNRGPSIERYVAPAKTPANWCAGFVGWCYQEAAEGLGVPLPFKRSLGAKRLGKNVGAVGRVFSDPTWAQPGDLMVFHRGAKGSWMGHVAMVERGSGGVIHTVEGNSGPRVIRRMRFVDRDRFAFFASLRS